MRAFAFAVLLASVAACGGSSAEPFAGCWSGTSTVRMASGEAVPTWLDNSVLPSPTAQVCIAPGTATSVAFLCGAGLGPQAVVTSPSSLTVSGFTCPSGGTSADVGVAIEKGAGALSGGVLTLSVDYVVTRAGQSYPVTFVLEATRSCTPGTCAPLVG